MEKIINALVLSPEQKEAFLAAAPGVEQVFLRDSDITAADLEGATVLLGNPSVAAVREGGTSLRWMHTRSARRRSVYARRCPARRRCALLVGGRIRHLGFGAHVRHADGSDEASARLPGQPER